ncbi:uncharacterized protein BO80DRAFT_207022 [Aspergillus ibericus CBS 121593]|uniref:Uncharacterized protein n=1 Tax=Aspergillus ibericus CBS 121593 TaxID=1448316 RepID=A0A395HB32_9EURO|nr:hypothetical protein BO80DRAFT_207022 [Aspergillus ibericus CBS 121593]RAL04713.1 hypothetical protein BO80DRAFT_207022 [Aspergillus ibericus CBS 121593]
MVPAILPSIPSFCLLPYLSLSTTYVPRLSLISISVGTSTCGSSTSTLYVIVLVTTFHPHAPPFLPAGPLLSLEASPKAPCIEIVTAVPSLAFLCPLPIIVLQHASLQSTMLRPNHSFTIASSRGHRTVPELPLRGTARLGLASQLSAFLQHPGTP